jgi:hypothetical protein
VSLQTKLEELVALGKLVIDGLEGGLSDTLVDERLLAFLSSFESAMPELNGSEAELTGAHKDLLLSLIFQHEEIERLVGAQLRSIDQRLRERKAWIKGVRGYLDSYPKSVSTIKTRRG